MNPYRFGIIIIDSPTGSQASFSALQFAQAAVKKGHIVQQVFFYHEGTYHKVPVATVQPPLDDLPTQWREFADRQQIPLITCVTALLQRRLMLLQETLSAELTEPSTIIQQGSLTALMEALLTVDRCITFGG
jgi:tRNA 2-thiouridine synthesizing protein D